MATAARKYIGEEPETIGRLVGLGLTERQAEIFAYLFESTMRDGYQPVVREICGRFGGMNTNAAYTHLKAIARKGWIEMGDGSSRALRFLRMTDGTTFRGFICRKG